MNGLKRWAYKYHIDPDDGKEEYGKYGEVNEDDDDKIVERDGKRAKKSDPKIWEGSAGNYGLGSRWAMQFDHQLGKNVTMKEGATWYSQELIWKNISFRKIWRG